MNGNLDHERAALSRLATGKSFADDVSVLRMAIDRLAALTTPLDDDVREALAKAFADALFHAGVRAPSSTLAVIAFKEVLTAFEVRPLGTVTDADAPEIPGFEGTRAAVDGLSIRGGDSS